jgi:hypothetical protein
MYRRKNSSSPFKGGGVDIIKPFTKTSLLIDEIHIFLNSTQGPSIAKQVRYIDFITGL